MKKQGTVVRWDDDRGFGFIRSPDSSAQVFFHARDFRMPPGQRPREGQAVTFEEIHIGGKGPRAMAVQLSGAASTAPQRARAPAAHRPRRTADDSPVASRWWLALPLMLAYGAVLAWAVWARHFPGWVLAASFFINLLAFFAYLQDKYAAQTGRWRIQEDTLHFWSLAGGWAGAWWAQQLLRHKLRKLSFLSTYWMTVAVHCAALGGWLWWGRNAFGLL